MGRIACHAKKKGIVAQRGTPSIEWHKDGIPQYYCHGYMDKMTDELLEVCRNCIDHADHAYEDYEKWKKVRENATSERMGGKHF